MKFLAVFVTLAAVACGLPSGKSWSLNEISEALQNPATDPALIPYLEAALNEIMNALHHGQSIDSINIVMPIVAEYTLKDLEEALRDPNTDPAYIPYLEDALDKIMDALFSGIQMESITVVLPPKEPGFIDVWPVQAPEEEPGFIDVWPVQAPEESEASPVAPVPAVPVAPAAPSSPLVQIIVNVQQESDVAAVDHVIERPMPAEDVNVLPGWGPMI